MGVLACDRTGCDNVMCDRFSHRLGYICNECFDEMLTSGLEPCDFMDTEKGGHWIVHIPLSKYDNEFPLS